MVGKILMVKAKEDQIDPFKVKFTLVLLMINTMVLLLSSSLQISIYVEETITNLKSMTMVIKAKEVDSVLEEVEVVLQMDTKVYLSSVLMIDTSLFSKLELKVILLQSANFLPEEKPSTMSEFSRVYCLRSISVLSCPNHHQRRLRGQIKID